METQQNQTNINLAKSRVKPVYADEVAIAVRVKAFKNEKGAVEKEGLIGLIFIDMLRQQSVGEFVINRATAKALIQVLGQNVAQLERELSNKQMPKPPEIKTTGGDSSYIR